MNRMENGVSKTKKKKTQKFSFITQFKSEMPVHKADPLDPARREFIWMRVPKTSAPWFVRFMKVTIINYNIQLISHCGM